VRKLKKVTINNTS